MALQSTRLEGRDPLTAKGVICPFCGTSFRAGDMVVYCPRDGTPHHVECWRGNQNRCTTLGCRAEGSVLSGASGLLPAIRSGLKSRLSPAGAPLVGAEKKHTLRSQHPGSAVKPRFVRKAISVLRRIGIDEEWLDERSFPALAIAAGGGGLWPMITLLIQLLFGSVSLMNNAWNPVSLGLFLFLPIMSLIAMVVAYCADLREKPEDSRLGNNVGAGCVGGFVGYMIGFFLLLIIGGILFMVRLIFPVH